MPSEPAAAAFAAAPTGVQDATPAPQASAFGALWIEAILPASVDMAVPDSPEPAPDTKEPQAGDSATATAIAAALLFVPPVRIWQFSLNNNEQQPVAVNPDAAPPQTLVEPSEPAAPQSIQTPQFEAVTADVTEAPTAAPESSEPAENRNTAVPAPRPIVVRSAEPKDHSDNPSHGEHSHQHAERHQPLIATTATEFRAASEQPSSTPSSAVEPPTVPTIPEPNTEMPLHRAGEAREITLDMRRDDGAVVQVRLATDNPGSVHIDIRATDEPVARELNAHAGELMSKLESSGFEIRPQEASAGEWNESQHGGHHQRRYEHDEEIPVPRKKSGAAFHSVFEMQER